MGINTEHYFLTGGGEMGKLMREKDWKNTPLGDPITWPQSLRTMVAVMLDNPFGMYIAWGNDYIQLYNDGYRPILGSTKHPKALGIGTQETFAEIWHIIGPMFNGVMEGTAVGFPDFMLPLNRNGFIEECYFDFSYSPIRKEDGTVGGVLVTVIETTNKKKAEDNLKDADKRFRNTVKQAPVGITILKGEEFIVEVANDAYLLLVDKKENEFVGRPLFDSLPEVEVSVGKLLNDVLRTGVPFHGFEYPISVNRYGKTELSYFNFEYHPLREENGKISGIIVTVSDVSESVKTKHFIAESEKQFRHMVMQSPIPMTIFRGSNHVIEMANTIMFEKIWRKKESDVIGRKLLDVFPELLNQKYPELLDEVYRTGKRHTEIDSPVLIQGDDELRKFFLDYEYAPLFEPNGQIYGILVTVNDVTEKVEARQKVEKSEKRFRSLIAQAVHPILILKGDDLILEVANDSVFELWRVGKDMLGKPFREILPEMKGQPFEIMLLDVLRNGVIHFGNEQPAYFSRPNGEDFVLYFNFIYKPYRESDESISGVIVQAHDVTEQVNARKKIEESEMRFRSLAETLPQLIWETDEMGTALFSSARWEEYTGAKPGGEDSWRAMIHPDDFDQNMKTWKDSLATGNVYRSDVRIKNKAGNYRWHTVIGEPVRSVDNKIIKWVGAFTDIHTDKGFTQELEKQVLERTQQLEQQNTELEKINKELQSFAYISSHDLQEPLRKIQTFASQILIKEAHNLSDSGKDKFERMQNSAKRMQTLIDDLLIYSRTSTSERKFQVTDLNEIIELVKEDLKEEIQLKEATINVEELCELSIIPFQFRQLMYNLISNSLKFAKKQSIPHISIKTKSGKGASLNHAKLNSEINYCQISVSDNGIGFEQQYSERIFEVFQRLHLKNEYSGTGIGLSIVKKIVENHNGIIDAKGYPNEGATFDIYIPNNN